MCVALFFFCTSLWNPQPGDAACPCFCCCLLTASGRGSPTEEGNEYFIDPKTNDTVWERPEAVAWVAMYDEEYQQHFYFNKVTNVCTFALNPGTVP